MVLGLAWYIRVRISSGISHASHKSIKPMFPRKLKYNRKDRILDIWVDADACPAVIKEILFRAAERTKTVTTLVSNQAIKIPKSKFINHLRVRSGFDVADNEIVEKLKAGDLVITSDIPLADEVLAKGGCALSPRGELFTKDDIKAKLNMRDFMDTLRSSGVQTSGPSSLTQADRKAFADHLDKWLVNNNPCES